MKSIGQKNSTRECTKPPQCNNEPKQKRPLPNRDTKTLGKQGHPTTKHPPTRAKRCSNSHQTTTSTAHHRLLHTDNTHHQDSDLNDHRHITIKNTPQSMPYTVTQCTRHTRQSETLVTPLVTTTYTNISHSARKPHTCYAQQTPTTDTPEPPSPTKGPSSAPTDSRPQCCLRHPGENIPDSDRGLG